MATAVSIPFKCREDIVDISVFEALPQWHSRRPGNVTFNTSYSATTRTAGHKNISTRRRRVAAPSRHKITRADLLYVFAIVAVIAAMFVIAFWGAKRSGMWNDEFCTVSELGIGKSFIQFLSDDLYMYALCWNPFTLIARFWWYIHPYSDTWLWMLTIVSASLSVAFVSGIGRMLGGKLCGAISALLIASAHSLMVEATVEFRYYAFAVLFLSIILYLYVRLRMNRTKRKRLYGCLLGICMVSAVATQVLAALALPMFFIMDIYFLLSHRLRISDLLIPYGIAIVFVIVPICSRSLLLGYSPALTVWAPAEAPTFAVVADTFWTLLDRSVLSLIVFAVGLISASCYFVYNLFRRKKTSINSRNPVLLVIIVAPFLDLLLFWIVSLVFHKTYIGILRYYVWIMPFLAVAAGFGIAKLCSWLTILRTFKTHSILAPFVKALLVSLLFIVFIYQLFSISAINPKHQYGLENASKWAIKHTDLDDPNNMYVIGTGYPQGVLQVYFHGWGISGSANIPERGGLGGGPLVSTGTVNQAIINAQPTTIYYLKGMFALTASMRQVFTNNGYHQAKYIRSDNIYIFKR